MLGLSTCR